MTKEEEFTLVKRVQTGESQLFEELVLAYQKQVYHLALRMTSNEHDALDISQEAFLRAYSSIQSFRGQSRFYVWLYRLTSNIAIDFLRRRSRKDTLSLNISDEDESEYEIPDERFSPERALDKKELRAAVAVALEALPHEYRQIVTLREISGLSYDELADVLELELGTVKSRLSRARKQLCALLLQSGNLSDDFPSKEAKDAKEV